MLPFLMKKIEEVLFFFYSWAPSPKIYYSLRLVLAVAQKQLSSVFYDLPHLSGYDSPLFPPPSTWPLKIWTVTLSNVTASAISGRLLVFFCHASASQEIKVFSLLLATVLLLRNSWQGETRPKCDYSWTCKVPFPSSLPEGPSLTSA